MTSSATDPGHGPAHATHAVAPITVGVDESTGSDEAVRWAAREAGVRGAPLAVVHAFGWGPTAPWSVPDDGRVKADLSRMAERIAGHAVELAHACVPDLDVHVEVVDAYPPEFLEKQADQTQMIVVGSHHLGVIGRVVLGSVSAALAARASCPVIVVCGTPADEGGSARVIVGVDPEHGTQQVLEFAFDFASRHALPLRPILCWRPDAFAHAPGTHEPPAPERAHRWLAEALAGWHERYPDVEVHAGVEREHPVEALTSAARPQDLVVVGRHGRLARFGTFLGSVSQGVLHHATCPVAVIPGPPPLDTDTLGSGTSARSLL